MAGSPPLAIILRDFLDSSSELTKAEPYPWREYPHWCRAAQDVVATDAEAVGTLLSYSEPLEESAVQHGWSITRGLVEPLLTFSLFTDCRAVLECCSLGLWLLDSGANSMERIRRSLLLRVQNVTEQEKLARSHDDEKGANAARSQITRIVRRARDLGVEVDGDGSRIIGAVPTRVELARDMLDDEQTYRILSGAAHGHASYLRQLGMKVVDGDPRAYTVSLPDEVLQFVTIKPVTWVSRLSRALRDYKGLATVEFENLYARALERIRRVGTP